MCKERPQMTNIAKKNADMGNGVELEKVGKFSYLGDMLDAEGGADLAVATRMKYAWKKFRELSPFLTSKGFSLMLKMKVCASCIRRCMIYGSEM
jgi:hypothetical protein